MLTDEKIFEFALKSFPECVDDLTHDELTTFARAIESECRLPQIDGLEFVMGCPDGSDINELPEWLGNLSVSDCIRITKSCRAYLKASKGG